MKCWCTSVKKCGAASWHSVGSWGFPVMVSVLFHRPCGLSEAWHAGNDTGKRTERKPDRFIDLFPAICLFVAVYASSIRVLCATVTEK